MVYGDDYMRTKMFKGSIIAFLLAIAIVFSASTALADSFVMPKASVTESGDGSAVFVYNPLKSEDYLEMGVYRNTEPLELIYPINLGEMVFENDFYFSDNMRHFVFVPTVSQDVAIEFYRDGILIQRYFIGNLVKDRDALTFSVSMAFWHDISSRNLNSTDNTFTVTTIDGLTYTFDIITGDVLIGEITIDFDPDKWHPFKNITEQSPKSPLDNVIIPNDLESTHEIISEGTISVIIEGFHGPQATEVTIGAVEITDEIKNPIDLPLLIGIFVIIACMIGLIIFIVVFKQKANI